MDANAVSRVRSGAGHVVMVYDSSGKYALSPDSLPQSISYNPDGTVASVTVGPDVDGRSFQQSYTYTTGNLTGISAWVLA